MSGTLVIGYGGYGCTCARSYSSQYSLPVLLIDTHAVQKDEPNIYQESLELTEDPSLNEIRLRNLISGYRNLLLVFSLGGDSFNQIHDMINKCARQADLTMVSVCTVPFSFESERRAKALSAFQSLPSTVDNLFIIDLQKAINEGTLSESYSRFLEETEKFVGQTLHTLVELLDRIPFSSYCCNPVYTLAIGDGPLYPQSIIDALEHPYFDISGSHGKILVCSAGRPSDYDADHVRDMLTSRFSTLPELIRVPGMGVDQTLLLIPIFCHLHE